MAKFSTFDLEVRCLDAWLLSYLLYFFFVFVLDLWLGYGRFVVSIVMDGIEGEVRFAWILVCCVEVGYEEL